MELSFARISRKKKLQGPSNSSHLFLSQFHGCWTVIWAIYNKSLTWSKAFVSLCLLRAHPAAPQVRPFWVGFPFKHHNLRWPTGGNRSMSRGAECAKLHFSPMRHFPARKCLSQTAAGGNLDPTNTTQKSLVKLGWQPIPSVGTGILIDMNAWLLACQLECKFFNPHLPVPLFIRNRVSIATWYIGNWEFGSK